MLIGHRRQWRQERGHTTAMDSTDTASTPPLDPRAVFFDEARARGALWTIRDSDGELASSHSGDTRIVPFWSSPERVRRFAHTSRDHLSYDVVTIPLAEWRVRRWYPSLRRDRVWVRLNWRTAQATQVEVSAEEFNAQLFPARRSRETKRRRPFR